MQPLSVPGVVLRITTRRHIKHDAAAPLSRPARMRKLNAKLRLANPCRTGHHGQRARQQSAPEQAI
jgi:hypothetical protein